MVKTFVLTSITNFTKSLFELCFNKHFLSVKKLKKLLLDKEIPDHKGKGNQLIIFQEKNR